jgi:predicted metalloprotease with PDZ domain
MIPTKQLAAFAAAILLLSAAGAAGGQPVLSPDVPAPQDRAYPGELEIAVDASDVQRRVIHVEERISGVAGEVVLLYPRWLPGNHSTTGPIERLAGLRISASGAALPWHRDTLDVNAFHVPLPAGAQAIEVHFDYLSPTSGKVDPVEMSPDLAVIDWISLVLYPAGYDVRRIPVQASLRLPAGWQLATALETGSAEGAKTGFRATTLETLADSPVYAGRYSRRFDLDPGAPVRVTLNAFADRPEQLALKDGPLAAHRALVQQAYRLFGSHHYAHYDFLVALSDQVAGKGLEHHESSEDSMDASSFSDWDKVLHDRDLLPHEFTHSWNGKFRRPADLWTPNYNVPMQDSLLWVYEGQTEYWGKVLAARAGLLTRQQSLEQLALVAAYYERQAGRQWRPLQDTTNDPILNHHHPMPWSDWQRNKDYYDESALIWLDADTLIRERSKGRRSLDDFARAFFGVNDASKAVVTYRFEDVVQALQAVEPYDWAAFLRARLDGIGRAAPLDGLARGGYRLVYTDKPNEMQQAAEGKLKMLNLSTSIGVVLDQKDASVKACAWGSPAFEAGLAESTQILAINGIAYDSEVLLDAIRAAQASKSPIELMVRNGNRFRVVHVDYTGGLRYPHLERDPSVPARLDEILAPRN